MKKVLTLILVSFSILLIQAQQPSSERVLEGKAADSIMAQMNLENMALENSFERVCKCSDSISVYNKSKDEIQQDISNCLKKYAESYQMMDQLFKVSKNDKQKEVNITVNTNPESEQYKKYYYKLERAVMDSCASVIQAMNADNKTSDKSYSDHALALQYYEKGNTFLQKKELEKAKKMYELAVDADPNFAFAWDNLGLVNRYLDNYDEAIKCYNKSLAIDPTGSMPLQNLAIVYQYKKDFKNAIATYDRMSDDNPEKFYGKANAYILQQDWENALDNICQSYVIYDDAKSPYRTDAEKLMAIIYEQMKKEGKQKKANKILKKYNIQFE